MPSFRAEVHSVLKQKGFAEQSHALERLIDTIDVNKELAASKVRIYKPLGLILLTVIPMLAAILSAILGVNNGIIDGKNVGFYLSMTLTLFTILNSIFKPSQRFHEACLIGIGIERFTINFIADLEKIKQITSEILANFVEMKRNQFETFQVALIELALPLEAASRVVSEEASFSVEQGHGTHSRHGKVN